MRLVRSRDTVPEIRVRRALHAAGLRFRLQRRDVPGRPDIVIPARRIAIFVHGCFWHRHPGCARTRTPKTRVTFWTEKFAANERRDSVVAREIVESGWRQIIVWECDTADPERLARLVAEIREIPANRRRDVRNDTPFNPLDYDNLTKNVVDELMRRGPYTLPLTERFAGGGVYALFYRGELRDYEFVRSPDASIPIYVGKAVPTGGRKGTSNLTVGSQLFSRLAEHTKSINDGADLALEDFLCRYLVVEPLWINMAETFLINRFRPVWNAGIDGFGNHDPGSGRHQGEISWWDARHPGRRWVASLRQTRTKEQASEEIARFARQARPEPAVAEELALEAAHEAAAGTNADDRAEDGVETSE